MLTADTIWLTIGFAGQLLFTSRFLVQWIASERSQRSVVPLARESWKAWLHGTKDEAVAALSLPAVCAPETAGEAVAHTVLTILREREERA